MSELFERPAFVINSKLEYLLEICNELNSALKVSV